MIATKRILTLLVISLPLIAGLYAWLPARPIPPSAIDRIVVIKGQHQMMLMQQDQIVKTYRVSLGRGSVAPKTREGDHRTPEGTYIIDWRNPQSRFHRSLHVSYPNSKDRQRARDLGVAPGGDIMIHGLHHRLGWMGRFHRWVDWTDGCIAVTNSEMDQIWNAVPENTPIEIRP
jgi:murein L,D-transpeptidase YafK